MKDLKELLNEMELDKVTGGAARPLAAAPELADMELLASGLAARLADEGYTGESLVDRLAKLPLADKLALAKIYIPDRLASGLADDNDELALAARLAEEIKKRLI